MGKVTLPCFQKGLRVDLPKKNVPIKITIYFLSRHFSAAAAV